MESNQLRLPKVLGLLAAASMVAGTVIGTGVFKKAPILATNLPDVAWVMAIWLLGGFFAFIGGLSFAEAVSRHPQAGGNQGILTVAYGPIWGFLWGWTDFWIIRSASIAALVTILVDALMDLVGTSLGHLSPAGRVTLASAILIALGSVQIFGVALGGTIMVLITSIKVIFLLLLALVPWLSLLFPETQASLTHLGSSNPPFEGGVSGMVARVGTAVLAVLWAYHGWGNIAPISEEVRDPRKNIPRALFLGIGSVTLLYVLVNLGYHLVLPMEEVRSIPPDRVAATEAFRKLLGSSGVLLASLAILCSVFGSLSGNLLAGPRLPFAMARAGQAPAALAYLHPRWRTPVVAIGALVAWSIGLLWIGLGATHLGHLDVPFWGEVKVPAGGDLFDWLTNFAMFGSIVFETLGIVAILRLRSLQPDWDGYRCPFYPIPSLFYLLLPAFLLYNMVTNQTTEVILGTFFSLAGVATYFSMGLHRSRPGTGGDASGSSGGEVGK